mmetsp:Transcript_108236/g.311838  ORF Transcript_108236/g.311838 Transcript_108236/m.311838 type:complete len:266 (-) Transcript_108236:49-846(-)
MAGSWAGGDGSGPLKRVGPVGGATMGTPWAPAMAGSTSEARSGGGAAATVMGGCTGPEDRPGSGGTASDSWSEIPGTPWSFLCNGAGVFFAGLAGAAVGPKFRKSYIICPLSSRMMCWSMSLVFCASFIIFRDSSMFSRPSAPPVFKLLCKLSKSMPPTFPPPPLLLTPAGCSLLLLTVAATGARVTACASAAGSGALSAASSTPGSCAPSSSSSSSCPAAGAASAKEVGPKAHRLAMAKACKPNNEPNHDRNSIGANTLARIRN